MLVRIDKEFRLQHTGALLRLLFMPQPDDPPHAVVALTDTPDDKTISVLAGGTSWWREYIRDPATAQGLQYDPQEWAPIKICDAELNETGVVATMASILTDTAISMLGRSAYEGGGVASDFTLVPRESLVRASRAFAEAGFPVHGLQDLDDREGEATTHAE
jgi:hypothetical protein